MLLCRPRRGARRYETKTTLSPHRSMKPGHADRTHCIGCDHREKAECVHLKSRQAVDVEILGEIDSKTLRNCFKLADLAGMGSYRLRLP